MALIAYHASQEQFKPSQLIQYCILAERAGFDAVSSSDHFHPWSKRQGQSGFTFSWIGAAMQATKIPFSMVCAPGQRYHPAIVAQAIATLEEMFPGRFSVALGSGEALNENITGQKWPPKQERNQRLLECAQVIRRLLSGEEVNHKGLVTVQEARLYTLPKTPPPLFGAAVTAKTAEWLGSWCDGLLTISKPYDELKEVVQAFRRSGGEGKPMYLKVQLSYDETEEKALEGAFDQWRTNVLPETLLPDLWKTEHYDAAAELVKHEDVRKMIRISADPEQHMEWIRKDLELGFDRIILHNVNRKQELFIRDFGAKISPHF